MPSAVLSGSGRAAPTTGQLWPRGDGAFAAPPTTGQLWPRGDLSPSASLPTYGPDQTAYTTEVPDSTGTGSSFAYGNDVVFAVAGRITSVRYYWVAASANANRTIRVYSSGQADLGSAAVPRGSAGSVGWATAALATPIAVTAGQTVRVVVEMPTSDTWGRVNAPGANVVNGDLTRLAQGWTTSGGTGYPAAGVGRHYFADIIFQKRTS